MDDDAAIQALSDGRMLKELAAQYGVSKVAVYKRLSKHPDYKAAIENQAHTWVEDAMQDVRECDQDTVNIARARVDAAFKYARVHNKDYADQITHEVGASFSALLEQVSHQRSLQQSAIIDVTPTKDT